MNTDNIHPTLKKSLAREINREAPLGLHAKIMKHVYAVRAQQLAAPSATPWVVLALLFAVAMIVLPLLATKPLSSVHIPEIAIPTFSINTPMLLSILGLICLYALSELPQLKHARKRA